MEGQPPAPPLSHFLRWGRWGRGLLGGPGAACAGRAGLAARLPVRAWLDRTSVCGEGGLRGRGKGRPRTMRFLPGSSNLRPPARLQRLRTPTPTPRRPPALQSPERSWLPRLGRPSSGWLCHHHRHDRHPAPARLQPGWAVCEPPERCCLDPLEEPGSKRPPNTGARLWGRVRSNASPAKRCAEGPERVDEEDWRSVGGASPGHPLLGAHSLLPARGVPGQRLA